MKAIYLVFFASSNGAFSLRGDLRKTIDHINTNRWAAGFAEQAGALYSEACTSLLCQANMRVDFRLWRDGEVSMTSPIFKDDSLRKNSEEYAAERGASFEKWAADQAYFFLRDICHVHQHHAPNIDTIMTLQPSEKNNGNWRNSILYSIHNYVIRVRRSGRNEDLHRARGVLAYAQSFKAVCETRLQAEGMSAFNYEAIDASLEAKIAENDFHDLQAVNIRNWAVADSLGFRNILIAFLGLVTAIMVVIMQPFMMKNQIYWEAVGHNIWSHKIQIGAPFTAILAVFWYFSEESVIRRRLYRRSKFIRDLKAITILHYKFFGLLALAASTVLLLAVAYLLS